jgi:hypothetical protein
MSTIPTTSVLNKNSVKRLGVMSSQSKTLPGFHVGGFKIHWRHEGPAQGQRQQRQRLADAQRLGPDVELPLLVALAGSRRRCIQVRLPEGIGCGLAEQFSVKVGFSAGDDIDHDQPDSPFQIGGAPTSKAAALGLIVLVGWADQLDHPNESAVVLHVVDRDLEVDPIVSTKNGRSFATARPALVTETLSLLSLRAACPCVRPAVAIHPLAPGETEVGSAGEHPTKG